MGKTTPSRFEVQTKSPSKKTKWESTGIFFDTLSEAIDYIEGLSFEDHYRKCEWRIFECESLK
jgi:hypothetical protein